MQRQSASRAVDEISSWSPEFCRVVSWALDMVAYLPLKASGCMGYEGYFRPILRDHVTTLGELISLTPEGPKRVSAPRVFTPSQESGMSPLYSQALNG